MSPLSLSRGRNRDSYLIFKMPSSRVIKIRKLVKGLNQLRDNQIRAKIRKIKGRKFLSLETIFSLSMLRDS